MMRPLADRVVVRTEPRRDKALRRSAGGVWLPAVRWTDGLVFGEVTAVGRDVRDVAAGARVMLGELSGTVVEVAGVEHRIVREVEIMMEAEAGVQAPDAWQ